MLLNLDDADAAVLYSLLPHLAPSPRHTFDASDALDVSQASPAFDSSLKTVHASLGRVRAQIAAEAHRMHLNWIQLDDDIQMGVPQSDGEAQVMTPPVTPESSRSITAAALTQCTSKAVDPPAGLVSRPQLPPLILPSQSIDRGGLPTAGLLSPLQTGLSPSPAISTTTTLMHHLIPSQSSSSTSSPRSEARAESQLLAVAAQQVNSISAQGTSKRSSAQAALEEAPIGKRLRSSDQRSDRVVQARRDDSPGPDDDEDQDPDFADANANADGVVVGVGKKKCEQRGGTRKRKGAAAVAARAKASAGASISEVQQFVEEQLGTPDEQAHDSEEGDDGDFAGAVEGVERGRAGGKKGKGKKLSTKEKRPPVDRWSTDGTPPPLCCRTSAPIVWLSYVTTSSELQDRLVDLLLALSPPSTDSAPCEASCSTAGTSVTSLKQLAMTCYQLETMSVVNDFRQMLSYMEFTLQYDWYLPDLAPKKKLSHESVAKDLNHPKITTKRVSGWLSAGTRLIYLAKASSMYIIPLIAAACLKNEICARYLARQISVLAFELCSPAEPDDTFSLSSCCGKLIRSVIIPQMALIKQLSSSLEDNAFRLRCPGNVEKFVAFSDLDAVQSVLNPVRVNFYQLPDRAKTWEILRMEMLTPSITPPLLQKPVDSSCVGEEIRISSPLDLKSTPCPVTAETKEAWTETERQKASNAREIRSLEELEHSIQELHAGGVRKTDEYICIDTALFKSKVLHIRDSQGRLLAAVATNLAETLGELAPTMLTQLGAIMAGEIFWDKSKRPNFQFLSWHCSYYNRYAEQGNGAPNDVHPNFVRKIHQVRVNHAQRTPHPSKEIEDNPEEAAQLAELIHLITLKKLHPEGYAEIKVFASKLPLNERSMAFPFGGFVINVCACTFGHRDKLDKLFCVVIPFGSWTGGELCMFEPGFVFRLHAWDMVLFPSCDVTHFNLHFEGIRMSLVLHSDKYGDQWVRHGNGWVQNGP
ncbi:hypothetical protein B0H14DRAFT_2928965 [Mycena olivaceomarginata]|nr:hypothetical protein B0H14DRAFT_2928965 [Mycena olivaceomarginata]